MTQAYTCSVEGGAECETKQVKLDAGKAKCKLRATENKPVSLENIRNPYNGRLFVPDATTSGAAGPERPPGGVGARVPLHR